MFNIFWKFKHLRAKNCTNKNKIEKNCFRKKVPKLYLFLFDNKFIQFLWDPKQNNRIGNNIINLKKVPKNVKRVPEI